MRTTLTLEPDVENLIREAVYRSGKTFKQAVNDAIRTALSAAPATTQQNKTAPFKLQTYKLGTPLVDLTKALSLAYELEDQAIIAKMQQNK
jgi:hypothetical protein